MSENQSTPRLYTVNQFVEKHPAFTHGSIRHLIFFEKDNGFAEAFVRIGRRVFVNEVKFFECVEQLQAA